MIKKKVFIEATFEELALMINKEVANAIAYQKTSQEEDVILTKREVAEYFQVTQRTIDNWTESGLLTTYRIGNQIRFKGKEVKDAFTKISA